MTHAKYSETRNDTRVRKLRYRIVLNGRVLGAASDRDAAERTAAVVGHGAKVEEVS